MNLERHLAVMWRHRVVVAVGLLLAVVLAFLASFQVKFGDGGIAGVSTERRGTEEWSSTSLVLVTQRGFPWGRVTLPAAGVVPGATPVPHTGNGAPPITYADPGRFTNLALLYSVISYSDRVRAGLPGHPRPDQIHALPLDPTGRGVSFLPVISLTTTSTSAAKAVALNRATLGGLRQVLQTEQETNAIPERERVIISPLNQAQAPVLVAGRSLTSSILAFLLCIVGAVALAHIIEAVRLMSSGRGTAPVAPEWAAVPTATDGEREPEEDDSLVAAWPNFAAERR